MTDRELLQQALDALKHLCLHSAAIKGYDGEQVQTSINALRARLAQPEQKPVVWRYRGNLHEFDPSDWASGEVTPLYTASQQREWVGLTDKDIEDCLEMSIQGTCRAIEAKLKDKNGNKSICY